MGLTDLLKDAGRALTLTAVLYSCGGEEKEGCSTDYDCREPRVCVRGYCEGAEDNNYSGNGDSDTAELAANLCQVVWGECGGLPGANYQVGHSYNDCRERGPEFIRILQDAGASEFLDAVECVASGEYSCNQLESDHCRMPEHDLFACIIDDEGGC